MLEKILQELGFTRVQEAKGIVEYRFDRNGLKVLLSENHAKPVVTYMTLFHVGSRNEAVGYTGSTHFLEHMMFKGTPDHNPQDENGVFEMIKPLGNLLNATTWFDRTNYFECVPSQHLALCIELEADRMRNLMIRQDDRDSEMSVVRNEMERGENDPDSVMMGEIYAVAFREHPYHHPTIGWRSDVEGVPLERMKQFYDDYYWPNNCTVMVRGDFESIEALKLIAQYYGHIPSSPKPIPAVYTVEPAQEGERRFELRRAGDLPRVWAAFHVPEAAHEDTYALAAMAAILGSSSQKSSRLYKRLIESGMASGASSGHMQQHDPGLFIVSASVAAQSSLDDVETAILDELTRLASEPVTASELKRACNANSKGTILGALDPMGWANMIAEGEASVDWRWAMEFDDLFDRVSAADVQRVAQKYFSKDNRTVGHFIPKVEDAPAAIETEVEASAMMPVSTGNNFASQVTKRVLSNGLTAFVQSIPGSGAVSLSGKVRAGESFGGGFSLLPELAAYQLTLGSHKYSKTDIAEMLEDMGPSASRFSFGTDAFGVSFGGSVVADDFSLFVSIIGELMRNPLYSDQELKRSKSLFASFLTSSANDSDSVANNTLARKLYDSSSPYAEKSYAELSAELEQITVDMLGGFHREHYSPKSTIITIVGDIDEAAAFDLLEQVFGDWTGPDAKEIQIPSLVVSTRDRVDVRMSDKKNVDIVIGLPVDVKRTGADFYAARIADLALGGDTIGSRLGKVVRVKHGLTYGINSQFSNTAFGGAPWLITLTVAPSNIDKALGLVDEVLGEYIKNGITDRELTDLTNQAVAGFQIGLRTDLAIAGTITSIAFLGFGVDELDSYPAKMKSVTKEQVNEAVRKYFRLDQAVTVVCGTF